MFKILFLTLLISGLSFSTFLKGDEYRDSVKPLKWMGKGKPDTYEEYKRAFPSKPLSLKRISMGSVLSGKSRGRGGTVVVMVNSSILSSIQYDVAHYVEQIAAQGYSVELLAVNGGTPESIKDQLNTYRGLEGCVMIGQLPAAWYEVANDYGNRGHAEFPCDLFYMDLNGYWGDSDGDGIYDNHTDGSGDRQPEIFVARIDASGLGRYEVQKLQAYFGKNRSFWNGYVDFNTRGVAYTEDDWVNYPDISDHLTYLCNNNTYKVKAPSTSSGDYFANYLSNSIYYITQLACHAGSGAHFFTRGSVLTTAQVIEAPPESLAYNLFCCSALRYTSNNCLGMGYIFNSGKALVVVGSTKTGSMLEFRHFYTPLSLNKRIGESLVTWFNSIGTYDMTTVYWHYGMTILGDPMVYLKAQPNSIN